MHRACVAAIVLTTAFLAAPSAHAQSFGDAGHLVISGGTALELDHAMASAAQPAATSLAVSPALDYFVVRNLSIGAIAYYGYSHQDALGAVGTQPASPAFDDNSLDVGPRVGYDIRLSPVLSVWPTAFGALGTSWYSGGGASGSSSALRVGASVPVLLHPVPHLLVGLGPHFETYPTAASKLTTYGLGLTVGGWL